MKYIINKIFSVFTLSTKKVVINTIYGGFGLSDKAIEWLKDNCPEVYHMSECNIPPFFDKNRSHIKLVEAVELFKDEVNAIYSYLKIVEIPDNVEFTIEEYDGNEWIAEKHRTWS